VADTEKQVSKLLMKATQKHDEKKLDSAIDCLREAYDLMDGTIFYPIATFLRLPLYLQQSGRYPEARLDFENLLAGTTARINREFSHISGDERESLAAMDRSVIYDKMRLAAQREKHLPHVICWKILSIANRAVGLNLQRRGAELYPLRNRDIFINGVSPLLKKAKLLHLSESLVECWERFARDCSNPALNTLEADLHRLLEIDQ